MERLNAPLFWFRRIVDGSEYRLPQPAGMRCVAGDRFLVSADPPIDRLIVVRVTDVQEHGEIWDGELLVRLEEIIT